MVPYQHKIQRTEIKRFLLTTKLSLWFIAYPTTFVTHFFCHLIADEVEERLLLTISIHVLRLFAKSFVCR